MKSGDNKPTMGNLPAFISGYIKIISAFHHASKLFKNHMRLLIERYADSKMIEAFNKEMNACLKKDAAKGYDSHSA